LNSYSAPEDAGQVMLVDKPVDLANLGQRCTGIAHHFHVGKVPDICLCDTAGIATDWPLVYGKPQGITQPASASNIPIPRANPAQ
jgi:hypothetical protein